MVDECKSGRVLLGTLGQPLRNGSCEVWLAWEARIVPERVCEGNGWYSPHPTRKVWHVWSGLEHKRSQPRFPDIGEAHDTADLDARLQEIIERAARSYGFRWSPSAVSFDVREGNIDA